MGGPRPSGELGKERAARGASWSDESLVRECLRGSEEAWSALIDRYRNLIFSVPIKQGLPREDAADIFQAVCVDLLTDLPRLREPKALPAWLIRVTMHKCQRWERAQRRFLPEESELPDRAEPHPVAGELFEELRREQALREAISTLPPRCRHLVHSLFYVTPPLSYERVAASLGLATGSIGFIRARCLEQLRRRLAAKGFP